MNETQKRIQAYKNALPGLKERVMAVALLLVLSASMMTSATFAWITLSRAPEVSGMATTVAANGSLEIALVNSKGDKPAESGTSDSSEAQGMVKANLTWGNLVNLSDPSYGLDKIALRPALLSDYNRTVYPLYGATYGKDGRVVSTSDRYMYATWDAENEYFAAGDKATYGVRAISSVKMENITGNKVVAEMWTNVDNAYTAAQKRYLDLIEGRTTVNKAKTITCIDALQGMVQTYAQEMVDKMFPPPSGTRTVDYSGYVTYFYRMMAEFMEILKLEGQALVNLANLQAYAESNGAMGTDYFKSIDDLVAADETQLDQLGVKLESMQTFKDNYKDLQTVLNGDMKSLSEQCDPDDPDITQRPTVQWSQISGAVNIFVNIETTMLGDTEIKDLASAGVMKLVGYLSGKQSVLIKDGILKDYEKRTGTDGNRMASTSNHKDVEVAVTLNIKYVELKGISASAILRKEEVTVPAKVTTDAADPFLSVTDRAYTMDLDMGSVQGSDAAAKDTYGMAIDLWVRTNSADTVLTLEGETRYIQQPDIGKDRNGADTPLYTIEVEDKSIDIYQMQETRDEQDVIVWYYADNHQELEKEVLTAGQDTIKAKMKDVVVGFDGANRVWEEEEWQELLKNGYVQEDSTTQGSGSCFVFYADPSEQTRILDLLSYFSIAFVDEKGTTLGTAALDVESFYSINGKVTVPLKMVTGTTYLREILNEDGGYTGEFEECLGIMPLEPNEATWITSIIYLNGEQLKNENVLSVGDIQGRLNIQFGSSNLLDTAGDTELQKKYRTITAAAEAVTPSVGEGIVYNYDGTEKTVRVTLTVAGEQPEKISGFFVRSISATQGTRYEEKIFTDNGDGTWTATFDFLKPGSYLMRTLIVDGVEYELDSNFPSVTVNGLNIETITVNPGAGMHMTADNTMDVDVTVKINATPELMPSQVRAQFRGYGTAKGKEVNALMNYDSTTQTWTGTATISTSGTYTLEYVVMDGQFELIDSQMQKTLIVYLGMECQIWTTGQTNFEFKEEVALPVQVEIWDNSDNKMGSMDGVKLFYHSNASALDENGMYVELKWDGEQYVGNLPMTKAGRYSFDRLQITTETATGTTTSTIRKAISAPVFVAMPPDPPAYIGYVANEYQVSLDGTAELWVNLAYAESATIGAKIINLNDGNKEYLVYGQPTSENSMVTIDGEEVKVTKYKFTIPDNASQTQDGEWQLMELYFQDVYVDGKQLDSTDGKVPGAEDSGEFYTIDVSGEGGDKGIYAYVVETMNVAVTKDGKAYTGENFGVDANGTTTGYFMDSYDVENVTVTVQDWNGRVIQDVQKVIWHIEHTGLSKDYGGYTGPNPIPRDVELTGDSENKVFTAPTQTFQVAGKYSTSISVQAGGKTYTVLSGSASPAYTVKSLKPYVQFTSTYPTEGTQFSVAYSKNPQSEADTRKLSNSISADKYSVTCYFEAKSSDGCSCGGYNTSKATVTLYNMGSNFTSATCIVESNGTADDVTYRFTPSKVSNEQTLGKAESDTRYYLGTDATGDTLTVEYDTKIFTFELANPLKITLEY